MRNRIRYIFISILALVNVVSVPFYEIWGGLVPKNPKNDFVSVMHTFFEDPSSISQWAVKLTICVLVPSLLMFIVALFGNRILFITADIVGIIFWFAALYDYKVDHFTDNNLFNINDTSISIGYWVAIVIYALALVVGFVASEQGHEVKSTASYDNGHTFENEESKINYDRGDYGDSKFYGSYEGVNTEKDDEFKFCPYCAAKLNGKVRFCGKCGHRL